MATMNTADIGFEREIWKAADKMRGNIDASEYKSVVLGLIFLKYISDKFETKYRQRMSSPRRGSLSPRAKDSRRTRTNIRPKISSMSRPKPAGSGLRPRRTRPK